MLQHAPMRALLRPLTPREVNTLRRDAPRAMYFVISNFCNNLPTVSLDAALTYAEHFALERNLEYGVTVLLYRAVQLMAEPVSTVERNDTAQLPLL